MEPLSIGEKVLDQAEQGALLSWTEALESGQLPTRWPINLWFALFLFRFNKGWSALLISHMSDAPLQQDVLPPPGCQAEQVTITQMALMQPTAVKTRSLRPVTSKRLEIVVWLWI